MTEKYRWLQRATTYMRDFRRNPAYDAQEQAIIAALRSVQFSTVFEFGCGFGRITKLILEAARPSLYVATDVSAAMLKDAARHVGDSGVLVFAQVDLDAVTACGPADLAVAVEVLMHRTPEQVARDVRTLSATSARHILTADWDEMGRNGVGCYAHDYRALFEPWGNVQAWPVAQARQSVFLVTKREPA